MRRDARVGPHLPLLATGDFEGYVWRLHGLINADRAYVFASISDSERQDSYGGGTVGALPFGLVEGGVLGHIGSTLGLDPGEESLFGGTPGATAGVVSGVVSRVVVVLSNGTQAHAMLANAGNADTQFFFVAHRGGLKRKTILALDVNNNELDRC